MSHSWPPLLDYVYVLLDYLPLFGTLFRRGAPHRGQPG
jgi:hypothetical protein